MDLINLLVRLSSGWCKGGERRFFFSQLLASHYQRVHKNLVQYPSNNIWIQHSQYWRVVLGCVNNISLKILKREVCRPFLYLLKDKPWQNSEHATNVNNKILPKHLPKRQNKHIITFYSSNYNQLKTQNKGFFFGRNSLI